MKTPTTLDHIMNIEKEKRQTLNKIYVAILGLLSFSGFLGNYIVSHLGLDLMENIYGSSQSFILSCFVGFLWVIPTIICGFLVSSIPVLCLGVIMFLWGNYEELLIQTEEEIEDRLYFGDFLDEY